MTPNPRVGLLEGTLRELVPALARLRAHSVAQRQAVSAGDLGRLVSITAEQEEVGLRVAQLEQRRRTFQETLETELDVRGLRDVAQAGTATAAERQRLLELLEDLRDEVVRLREENRRNSDLLESAIDVSRRIQNCVGRFTTNQATYGPMVQRAARRARAAHARRDPTEPEALESPSAVALPEGPAIPPMSPVEA
jgi:flagellar biosynthesis/type III secretory pathway chaperone